MRGVVLAVWMVGVAGAQTRVPVWRAPVWIDTDPSVAPGGHEVDDGVALLQAFASPELEIRGVSIVFGNAELAAASRIGREMVGRFGATGLAVHDGAAGRSDLGKETAASRALAAELRRGPLTVLALGPATNVATVVRRHPELVGRIARVVAVAGRRPGQSFRAGPKQKAPFRDLNFELDPEAFRVLLAARVPLVLAPWEISSGVWMVREDVEKAAKGNAGVRWMLPALLDWIGLWKREFGAEGFNPFDALAVGYVVKPDSLECARMRAWVEERADDTGASAGKPYLLVAAAQGDGDEVTYCSVAKPEFKIDLLRRLSGARR
ncbi:MAG: nucleoside hydrolase [Acidobacteria bacterium]|nr:nucleoside hydrolase [Acidobacteriota bacterium]